MLSKCQIIVNKMFQNNFEHWNSACQSFNLTTLLSHIRVSKNFYTSEVRTKLLVKMSRVSLRVQIIFCWRFDYVMRAPIWEIDCTIFWALFTSITILKSEIYMPSVLFGSPSIQTSVIHFPVEENLSHSVRDFQAFVENLSWESTRERNCHERNLICLVHIWLKEKPRLFTCICFSSVLHAAWNDSFV